MPDQNPRNLSYIRQSAAKIEGDSFTILLVNFMPAPASPPVRQNFDYASLDADTSRFVQQQTGEIRVLMRRTAQDIFEVGQKLSDVKQRLGHGNFEAWLKAEFDWGEWTARKFMQVAQQFAAIEFTDLQIAPSALYLLAASSTPDAAKAEVLDRAKAGETITHATAKAIKQKYATPPKPKPEPISQPQPQSLPTPTTPATHPQSGSKLEIVAFRPQIQAPAIPEVARVIPSPTVQALSVPQSNSTGAAPDVPGIWWQLGGKHLLYCGDPNSAEFLARVTEKVSLLLAFPPISDWQTRIRAKARIIVDEYLPQDKNLDQLDEFLESSVLFNSRLKDTVVTCFLPVPDIVSVISRLDRQGLFAEPDSRRVNAVVTDWKKAGVKVERLS